MLTIPVTAGTRGRSGASRSTDARRACRPANALAALVFALAARPSLAADELPLARIGSETISEASLRPATSAASEAIEASYAASARRLAVMRARMLEEVRWNALQQLLDERVVALEAEARHTTTKDVVNDIHPDPVTSDDVSAYYDARKPMIGAPLEAADKRLTSRLNAEARERAERQALDGLRRRYGVKVLAEPLRERVVATGPALGPQDAPVTLVEFGDFQCPFCAAERETVLELHRRYPTQLRIVFRQLPLADLHPNAERAAEASLCAEAQGRFWEMHNAMFLAQDRLDATGIVAVAASTGLDVPQFETCLRGGRFRASVEADAAEAAQLALEATPSFFVNGRLMLGAVPVYRLARLIDEELGRAAVQPPPPSVGAAADAP